MYICMCLHFHVCMHACTHVCMYAIHVQYVSALLHAGMAQAPYGEAGEQAAAIVADANSPARLVL